MSSINQKEFLKWCKENNKPLTKLSVYEFEGHLGDKKDKINLPIDEDSKEIRKKHH